MLQHMLPWCAVGVKSDAVGQTWAAVHAVLPPDVCAEQQHITMRKATSVADIERRM